MLGENVAAADELSEHPDDPGYTHTPRIIYHFLSPKYQVVGDGGTQHYEAEPYEFPNKHNEMVSTQIIKNNDVLQEVIMPENNDAGLFYGWYKVIDEAGNTEPTPYNFMNHIEEPIRLKAKWVQVGEYSFAYNPTMRSIGITGDMARYNDPSVKFEIERHNDGVKDIPKHTTKYMVDYKHDSTTHKTTITNTAALEITIYKRWINFRDKDESEDGKDEKPESVYIMLMSKVKRSMPSGIPKSGKRTSTRPL